MFHIIWRLEFYIQMINISALYRGKVTLFVSGLYEMAECETVVREGV